MELIQSIKEGKYKPKPVKRVEIPKPDGGVRLLGVPTAIDRMWQQALVQILEPIFEPAFSDSSYGFRPKRNAQQAIKRAKEYYEKGYTQVVDIDLEKYFDTVNHDITICLYSNFIIIFCHENTDLILVRFLGLTFGVGTQSSILLYV